MRKILHKNESRHGRFGDRVRPLVVLGAALLLGGCVVHDGKNNPEPSWWPNFLLREETVKPTGGKVNVNVDPKGWPEGLLGGGDPHVSAEPVGGRSATATDDGMAVASSIAPVWFDPGQFYNAAAWYHPAPYERLNGGAQSPAAFPQQDTPTLHPNRGQAALESGSPTLYPASGTFQTSPQHDVTLYPHGPVGPRGFRGQ